MNESLDTGFSSSSPQDVAGAILAAINVHAIVSLTDASGTINWVNERFCQISGYSAAELLGKNHSMLRSGVHPPAFYAEMWKTIARGRTWSGEICNRRKNGQLYWVASTIMPVLGHDGRPERYVSIRTDITAVKDSENQLRYQRDLQLLISEVAADLLAASGDEMHAAVDRALAKCGAVFNVERAWLFRYSEDNRRQTNTNEWCAPGVSAEMDKIQQQLRSELPWWDERIARGVVVIDDVAALPPEAWRERAVFVDQGIRSLIGVPLRTAANAVCGFIGFDSVHATRTWSEEETRVLGVLAGLFSTAKARVEAECLSEANKERLRRGQIYANIGTWDWNIVTGELYWTERIGPLFGYAMGELGTSYENFLKAVHPDDRARLMETVNTCIVHDVPYDIEHRVVWPDGTVRWLQERGAVTRDADGRAIRMLGVVQDIHDRKQAELQLAEREKLLREAQTLAHIGNWTAWQRSGRLDWSDEIYRIFGYEPGSFQPSIEAFMATVHPEDKLLVASNQALAEKTGSFEVTHRIVRPDGSIRHVHEVAHMTVDADGPLLLTGTVQDVTELKQTEFALIAARDEAERANRAKSQFLSSMSHELRTPLNAILGFSQLLAEQLLPEDQQRECAREIFSAGEHLLNLINEVLDLARIEAGKVELKLSRVCSRDVLHDSLVLVRNLAEQHGVTLLAPDAAAAPVLADPIRLKQVLVNLLSNAIKYNRPGGTVETRISTAGGLTRIQVLDSGIGIDPQRQQELFQPFSRLGAEELQVEGSGMGLNISKHLVELMGGSIGVRSEPGHGSVFWITLPAAPDAQSVPGRFATQPAATRSATAPRVKTVLYVEDNPTNVKLMQRMLEPRADIRLLHAHTPVRGLELATSTRPDLILLDINLPGMDGYQLLQLLQADPDAGAVPVVAVSAYAMQADIDRGLAAGFTDYITKPVNATRLANVLDAVLDARTSGQIEIL